MKSTTCINDHTNDVIFHITVLCKCKKALKLDPVLYCLLLKIVIYVVQHF